MVRWLLVALFAALGGLPAGGLGAAAPCLEQADLAGVDAVLVALVDVHGGADCDQVKLRSLHKIAAAQHTAQLHNIDAPIKIGVHVMDTCGNKKKAVRLAFKSLVYTDPSICKKPPIMLGYLGPEDKDTLAAVQQVTRVYNYVHLNPLAPTGNLDPRYMTKVLHSQKVKALTSVLRQLHWSTFSVLYASDAESTLLASALGTSACVPVARELSEAAPFARLDTRGVVVIAPSDQLMPAVRANAALDSPHALVLVALDAGAVPPLALMDNVTESVLLLQLAPPRPIANLDQQLQRSYLWDEYLHQQRCNFSSCSVEDSDVADLAAAIQDVAVTGISQAVAAFAKVLKTAHHAKCADYSGSCPELDAIPPEEWRSRMRAETNLQLALAPHFDIFFKQAYAQGLLRVANFSQFDFPDSKGDDCRHQVTTPKATGVIRRITTTPAPRVRFAVDHGDDDDIYSEAPTIKAKPKARDFWAELHLMSNVELGGVLFGFACLLFIVLVSCVYCTFSIFRIPGRNQGNRSKDSRSARTNDS